MARRNCKVFMTGISVFPKSLDVSKAIDKVAGAQREILGNKPSDRSNRVGRQGASMVGVDARAIETAPVTELEGKLLVPTYAHSNIQCAPRAAGQFAP